MSSSVNDKGRGGGGGRGSNTITGRGGGRGGRGGRGGHRGGGGRGGGGGGGGRGQQQQRGRQQTNRQQPNNKTADTEPVVVPSSIDVSDWLVSSLECLGCPQASEWKDAAASVSSTLPPASSSSMTPDQQLLQILLWLEDRLIRQWDVDSRNILRSALLAAATSADATTTATTTTTTANSPNNDSDVGVVLVWKEVQRYLADLDCPTAYYCSSSSSTDTDWRTDPGRRVRVLQWLIACATSEEYGDRITRTITNINDNNNDIKDQTINNNDNNISPKDAADEGVKEAAKEQHHQTSQQQQQQQQVDRAAAAAAATVTPNNIAGVTVVDNQKYPLGFSTGDTEIDQVLIILRMKLLLELQDEQLQINNSIARLQAATVAQAKPLKQYKKQQPQQQQHHHHHGGKKQSSTKKL